MDKIAPRFRRWRFGLAGLFALVAMAAIVAALWNPFPKEHSKAEFLAIEIGTPIESVVEDFGPPRDQDALVKSLEMCYYDVDGGTVYMFFRDGKFLCAEFIDATALEDVPLPSIELHAADRYPRLK